MLIDNTSESFTATNGISMIHKFRNIIEKNKDKVGAAKFFIWKFSKENNDKYVHYFLPFSYFIK